MKWLPAKFNDSLAIVIVIGTPLMWYIANWSEVIIAATLPIMTLVAQHYFRKKTDEKPPEPGG